jgi:hypothetical protein
MDRFVIGVGAYLKKLKVINHLGFRIPHQVRRIVAYPGMGMESHFRYQLA